MHIYPGQTKIITFSQSQRNKHNELIRKRGRNMWPVPSAEKHATDAKRGKMRVSQLEIMIGWALFLNGLIAIVVAVIDQSTLREFLESLLEFFESLLALESKAKLIHESTPLNSWESALFFFKYPGRAIRHRGDYATILLLDQRYGSARIQRSLPGWISNRLQHHARFGSAFAAIRKVSYWVGRSEVWLAASRS